MHEDDGQDKVARGFVLLFKAASGAILAVFVALAILSIAAGVGVCLVSIRPTGFATPSERPLFRTASCDRMRAERSA